MVSIKKTMILIKKDERLRKVFHFETDSKKNFNYMLSDSELREELSFVNWIYMSTISQATLIGLIEKEQVFTMDTDGETFILCDSFFEIPFELVKDYVRCENYKISLHNKPEHKKYLENLEFYANWCKENDINIDKRYLDILKP